MHCFLLLASTGPCLGKEGFGHRPPFGAALGLLPQSRGEDGLHSAALRESREGGDVPHGAKEKAAGPEDATYPRGACSCCPRERRPQDSFPLVFLSMSKHIISSNHGNALRRGKWTPEEEEFAKYTISVFQSGVFIFVYSTARSSLTEASSTNV